MSYHEYVNIYDQQRRSTHSNIFTQFTTNSFTLTSPSLTPLGVCVSPAVALINHSCDPNAVVVFPRSAAQEPFMQVIAIKPIAADEEVRAPPFLIREIAILPCIDFDIVY